MSKPIPTGVKKKSLSKRSQVRCLGPREPEHTFASLDPKRLRICPRCLREQKRLNPSLRDLSGSPVLCDNGEIYSE